MNLRRVGKRRNLATFVKIYILRSYFCGFSCVFPRKWMMLDTISPITKLEALSFSQLQPGQTGTIRFSSAGAEKKWTKPTCGDSYMKTGIKAVSVFFFFFGGIPRILVETSCNLIGHLQSRPKDNARKFRQNQSDLFTWAPPRVVAPRLISFFWLLWRFQSSTF